MNSESTSESQLVTYLLKHQEDRAMLAALRRGLGMRPGAVPDMLPYVVPFVRSGRWQESTVYLIASLFGLHPSHTPHGNMGAHVRKLAPMQSDGNDAVERRFTALLRTEDVDLEYPLRQMISLLKTKEIPVNWHQLMSDIARWNHPELRRNVVRRWASSFWNPQSHA
ncbi:type I-E CRISPR-associated protein Cse2/CasB [Aggregatilineales bacterium SYSU G02658]